MKEMISSVGHTLNAEPSKKLKHIFLIGPVIKFLLGIFKRKNIARVKTFVIASYHRILLFNMVNQLYFFLLFKKAEYYQPLYNFSVFKYKRPQRICIDRADRIYQELKSWGKGARILDIGCNLGFFSYYFAERGYLAHGMDTNPDNISVCQLLKRIHRKKMHKYVDFFVAELNQDYIKKIDYHQYDVVFLFSVIHHVIHYKGLEYAQNLMAQLLQKIPVLFIELAISQEQTTAYWQKSLPQNELEVFAKCKDITIQKLDSFPNHLSSVWRPLYVVKKNAVDLCGEKYAIYKHKFASFYAASHCGRQYFDCGKIFAKRYQLNEENLNQITYEINNYKVLPKNDYLPEIISFQQEKNVMDVIFNKLPGANLHELLAKGEKLPLLNIFNGIVKGLAFLYQHGLYHNDIRLWNCMYDGNKTYLLDLGLARKEENENTNLSLLWIIAQLHHVNYYNFDYPLTTKPYLNKEYLQAGFLDIVAALEETQNFGEFLAKSSFAR